MVPRRSSRSTFAKQAISPSVFHTRNSAVCDFAFPCTLSRGLPGCRTATNEGHESQGKLKSGSVQNRSPMTGDNQNSPTDDNMIESVSSFAGGRLITDRQVRRLFPLIKVEGNLECQRPRRGWTRRRRGGTGVLVDCRASWRLANVGARGLTRSRRSGKRFAGYGRTAQGMRQRPYLSICSGLILGVFRTGSCARCSAR